MLVSYIESMSTRTSGHRRVGRFVRRCLRQRDAESFVGTLKSELVQGRTFTTRFARFDVELAVVEYVGWFNHAHLHESSATGAGGIRGALCPAERDDHHPNLEQGNQLTSLHQARHGSHHLASPY
jgi:transposase InsO family protein